MGDESVVSGMSGMSTGDAGGPALGGPQQGGAEGVMKKLSNYWFIVGSIPLVMFLIVCLPTVFYVHSISSYVNAFYCRSKACDNLAEATKAVRSGAPCNTYTKSVCDASPKHSLKAVYAKDQKFLKDSLGVLGDAPDEKFKIAAASAACGSTDDIPDAVGPAINYLFNNAKPPQLANRIRTGTDFADVYERAQKIGIDSIFHLELVHSDVKWNFNDTVRLFIGEAQPPENNYYDLAVSAPDMGIMDPQHYVVQIMGKKHEAIFEYALKAYSDSAAESPLDDETIAAIAKLASKYYELTEIAKDKDYTAAPTVVELSKFAENSSIDFQNLLTRIYPQLGRVIVRSPTYVRYLSLNVKPGQASADNPFTEDTFKAFVYLDALSKLMAYGMKLEDLDVKRMWCLRYFDWMRPLIYTNLVEAYLGRTYWPIGLRNPSNPRAPLKSVVVGRSYFKELMDSFLHSYSLSEASSEKSRAGLFLKMLQMDQIVFYPAGSGNDTGADKTYIEYVNLGKPAEEMWVVELLKGRASFFETYWKLTPTPINRKYLLARHPLMYGDDEGSYDYGSNAMYVSFGMFRPSYHRDSPVYMGNYATFGYWGSMNILKMLDNVGAHSKVGYQHPVLWTGTYAYGKMASHYRCLNPDGANSTQARIIARGSNALTPGFRFFRRMALARALPRPEYRLDADSDATMEQIYFTAVARSYCRYKGLYTAVDQMFKNDLYFQSAYCEAPGRLKVANPNAACYIWRSTRRNY